jgi:hypothetical protein
MNLISAALTTDQGAYHVVADGVRVPLPRAWAPALDGHGKRAVVFGIRPDSMAPAGAMDALETGRLERLTVDTDRAELFDPETSGRHLGGSRTAPTE